MLMSFFSFEMRPIVRNHTTGSGKKPRHSQKTTATPAAAGFLIAIASAIERM